MGFLSGVTWRLTTLSISLTTIFCATVVLNTAAVETPPAADDKQIVDCLLQGQIRRLGTSIYQAPPRPVQIPAVDCAIRGGDFMVYDRANYATSMAYWLDLAKGGDVNAQIYLAQMFERGLGTGGEPDYAQAANWYRAAAEAGSSVGQINLAQLYEKGLGVEPNPAEAQRLYRLAFGTPASEPVVFDPGTVENPASTIQDLEAQLAEVQGEARALNTQLKDAQLDLSDAQRELQEKRQKEELLQAELVKSKSLLTESQGSTATTDAARAELEAREGRLNEQRASINRLESEITRSEKQIVSYEGQVKEISDLEAALRNQTEQYQKASRELRETKVALDESSVNLRAKKAELLQKDLTLEDQSKRLQALKSDVDKYQAQSRALQDQLSKIGQDNEKLLTARAEAARYHQESTQLKSLLDAANTQLADARKKEQDGAAQDGLRSELDRLQKESQRYKERISQLESVQVSAAPQELVGPSVELIEPIASNTRGTQEVTFPEEVNEVSIVGRVTAPAGLLSLKFNDHAVEVNDRNVFEVQTDLEEGRSVARFVAVDNQGKRAERVITLVRSAIVKEPAKPKGPKVKFGKFHALLIGNQNYALLNDLVTPKADVEDLGALLKDRYGFEVTTIADGTREQIMDGMYKLLAELTSEDNLLIYYAGHGEYVTDTSRGVWLPVDANPKSPANWISNIEISDYLKQIRAKQIIVIADSCYSGALTRSAMINLRPGLTDEEYQAQLEHMSKKVARVVLTSGGLAPVLDSATPGGKHSIFAGALLDVLTENDAILSGQDLSRTLAAKVSFAADRVGYVQEPQYAPLNHTNHQGGDFYFVPSSI
jgi:hypothetical protein